MRIKKIVITLAAAAALLGGIAQSFTLGAPDSWYHNGTPTHVRADGQVPDSWYHNG